MTSTERVSGHLTLQSLWACRKEKIPLSESDLQHLYKCDECLRLLGLCQMARSYEELVLRASDLPMTGT